MFHKLLRDEYGAVISAELALVLTILVIGVIVGLSEVAVAVNTELNDISNAIGSLDQSFYFTGFQGAEKNGAPKLKSRSSGSRFDDTHDDCDNNDSCDVVCGQPTSPTCG